MNEQKANIIKSCWDLFSQFGIKSVTMDDIATQMGISKKTIYQHFKNKRDMVEQAVEWQIQYPRFSFTFKEVIELNAIDQYIEFYKFITQILKEPCHSLHYDLKKYYPDLWDKIHIENTSKFQKELALNIKQGINEELYRPEINVEFISKTMARFYLNMAEADNKIISKDDILNIDYHKELAVYHLYGVCTSKGIEYFKNKIK